MKQDNSLNEKEKYQEEAFDKKAGKDKIYTFGGRDNRNHAIKIKAIAKTLRLQENDKVLEVGVGEGEHASQCLKNKGIFYAGIDISLKTLEVADKRLRPFQGRYELKKDNANNLSFDDNTFDAVFCAATLHHMENPFLMISEMARVLKPNGRIAMMEPNWIYPTNIGFSILLKEDRNMWIMRRDNFHNWLEKAGLKNINVSHLLYTPPTPKFMIPFYNIVDTVCSKLPVIRGCSLMLLGSAIK